MSLHRQPCPACGRELELPADAIGRLAKCPACNATFRTGETAGDHNDTTPAAAPPVPPGPNPPLASDDNEHPFQAPISKSSETTGYSGGKTVNPYQATSFAEAPVTRMGEIEIVQRPIEDIVSPTLAIFTARWSPLILATLIILGVLLALIGIPFLLISVAVNAIGDAMAGLAILLLLPVLILVSCYTTVGFTRVSLAVARNEPSPLSQLLPPMNRVLRFIGGMLVLLLGLGLVSLLGGAVIVGVALIDGAEPLVAILMILASIAGFALTLVAQWLLWPWIFVVSDGKASALESLRIGCKITLSNKLTSALVVIIATVLSMAGSAACYVGQLVTTPLTMLLFAVGYLLLTRQAIDNPKATTPYLPPTNPPPAH